MTNRQTNRQIAAELVVRGLKDIEQQIQKLPPADIAAAGDKQRISYGVADKVRNIAARFITPWVDRMERLTRPKVKRAKDEQPEAAVAAK